MNQVSQKETNTPENSSEGRVIVVDDNQRTRESIADVLVFAGYQVHSCASAIEALNTMNDAAFDLVITDLQMPGMDGLEFIREINARKIAAQVIMVTAHASVSSAIEAMRHGVFDYLEKPLRTAQIENMVQKALEQASLDNQATRTPPTNGTPEPVVMIGDSPVMRVLREQIARVAGTDETVLLTGESGTGKELVAKSLHAQSRRGTSALVGLNCPALTDQLTESELFGHERGAFTGAESPRIGRFELANGGTILLDEITEISLPLQAKLLRVLQERTFERVGSSESRAVDVRILASTNRNLQHEVAAGRFREDLYFRLAVVPLVVPPLRHRREDIQDLVDHFRLLAAERIGCQPCELHPETIDLMVNYAWPGNVRELENIVTRGTVLATNQTIRADLIRPWLLATDSLETAGADCSESTFQPGVSLKEMEQRLIETTLDHFDGHREKTAKALGIGVRTLSGKLRSYGVAPRAKGFSRAA